MYKAIEELVVAAYEHIVPTSLQVVADEIGERRTFRICHHILDWLRCESKVPLFIDPKWSWYPCVQKFFTLYRPIQEIFLFENDHIEFCHDISTKMRVSIWEYVQEKYTVILCD